MKRTVGTAGFTKRSRGLPLGYVPSRDSATKALLKSSTRTNLKKSVFAALGDLFAISFVAVAATLISARVSLTGRLLVISAALVIIARIQRGLECLVHEASHRNWSRSIRLNNFLANTLAALPVFSTVQKFRESHLIHHSEFASQNDPDWQRYKKLDIDGLDRTRLTSYLLGMISRLPSYSLSWWRAIGFSPRILACSLVWHCVVFILPLTVVLGARSSLAIWITYWLIPMMFLLPLIRFVAEAGEHVYEGNRNVFRATISNIGFIHRFFFHPHNDGYHVVHHLFPTVPHFKLNHVHNYLVESDSTNFGKHHRFRTCVVQQARAYETSQVLGPS